MPAFFHWPLEASSVDVLRSLVGQRIAGIALTGFEEAKPYHLRLYDVVLETDLGLVDIDALEWECTDKFKVSVFLPRIVRVDEPPQRWYREVDDQKEYLPWTRLAFEDVAPIRRVVVYSMRDEYSDDGLTEWTEYDHAFLFERDSGTSFLLRVEIEMIAGFLFLVQDQEAIAELVAGFTPRLVLE